MEDVIVRTLCNFCKNNKCNCMIYTEKYENKDKIKIYKCNNYERDYNKPKCGYYEKWIDNVCLSRGHGL